MSQVYGSVHMGSEDGDFSSVTGQEGMLRRGELNATRTRQYACRPIQDFSDKPINDDSARSATPGDLGSRSIELIVDPEANSSSALCRGDKGI